MIVAKYKFNPSTYSDYLPVFNSGFSYTKSDVSNSDGTITRTINSDSLPTFIRFGERVNASDKSRSLLEILSMNTSNITDMSYMFRYCENLTSVICDWNTSQATTMSHMFANCSNLLQLDVSKWNLSKVTQMQYIFGRCVSLSSLNVSNWDTSQVTNMEGVFNNCSSLTSLDVSNWNTSKVTTMVSLFRMCSSLTSLDVNNWDTSNVTNMANMFTGCSKLTSVDLSNWNTSNVINMSYMFDNCSSLISLDISKWGTSKVTNMQGMFRKCPFTSLELAKWDTSRVTNMNAMFWNCEQLTSLDLSSFNTSKVTDMSYMFTKCSSLTTLNLSNWDISQVINISNMLSNCSSLYKINLKYANNATVSKIHENLPNRSSATKGYILSSLDLTSDKNWQIIKSSHNNFYLPQPLNKIGDVKDRLYWDEDKGHYCIEQNAPKIYLHKLNWILQEGVTNLPEDEVVFKVTNFCQDNNITKPSFNDSMMKQIIKCNIPNLRGVIVDKGDTLEGDAFIYHGSGEIYFRTKKANIVNDSPIPYLKERNYFIIVTRPTPNIIDLPYLNQKLTFDSYAPSTTIDIPNRPLKASKTYLDAPIARYRYTNLQSSTQYNVQFDCKGDSGIKVNLGGTEVTFTPTSEWSRKNLTITTPSELVDDKLSISNVGITSNNKVDNVMLFSEVIAQEPDYIDTIQSIGELQSNGTYKIDVCTRQNNVVFEESDILETYNDIYTTHSLLVRLPMNKFNIVSYLFNEVSGLNACTNMYDYYATNDNKLWVNVGNKTDITSEDIVIILNDNLISRKQSIYLPQPLRKKGNAKDKLYWDDDKGHYCIEQNVSDNLEVLSSPNIIDLTEMNQKFSFDTYLPNTYVDVTNLPLQPYKLQLEDDTVRYKSTIEPSTLYTIQFNCVSKLTTRLTLDLGGSRKTVDPIIGVNHVQITTPSELTSDRLFLIGTGIVIKEVIVNKGNMAQYPKYFDGEQSVGELQEDKYRIDITSRSICLLFEKDDCIPFVSGTMWYTDFLKNKVDVIPGETYIAIMYNTVSSGFAGLNVRCYSKEGKFIKDIDTNSGLSLKDKGRFTVPQDCYYINFKLYTYEISDDLFSVRKLILYKGNFSNIETNKDVISNMARPASKLSFTLSQPLMKIGDIADKLYWNDIDKRYEIDRNGVIEVPTVEGDIINLPRLYQKVDTIVNISTDNIEPSKIDISYKDIH